MDMNRPGSNGEELDDDMVSRLLSIADAGPEIPRESLETAKRALRPLWSNAVRSRRRRMTVRTALAIAAVVMIAIVANVLVDRLQSGSATDAVAQVRSVAGAVWLETRPSTVRLTEGVTIPPGATIRSEEDGRVALRLSTGQDLRFDHRTEAVISTADEVNLRHGAVYVDSGTVPSVSVRIRTSLGEATDIGTAFEVRYEGAELQVLVRSGTVMLGLPTRELRVDRGRGVVVSAGADPRWTTVDSHAPEWDWARSVVPPFELEGRTVDAFLRWYERETGLHVSFADAQAKRLVESTILHGDTIRTTPELAAEGVLLSVGLRGEVRGGELTISSTHP